MQTHKYFENLDYQIHFGHGPLCEIVQTDDPLEAHIGFTIQIWHHEDQEIADWNKHMRLVHTEIQEIYGPMVFGEQPVARAEWH